MANPHNRNRSKEACSCQRYCYPMYYPNMMAQHPCCMSICCGSPMNQFFPYGGMPIAPPRPQPRHDGTKRRLRRQSRVLRYPLSRQVVQRKQGNASDQSTCTDDTVSSSYKPKQRKSKRPISRHSEPPFGIPPYPQQPVCCFSHCCQPYGQYSNPPQACCSPWASQMYIGRFDPVDDGNESSESSTCVDDIIPPSVEELIRNSMGLSPIPDPLQETVEENSKDKVDLVQEEDETVLSDASLTPSKSSTIPIRESSSAPELTSASQLDPEADATTRVAETSMDEENSCNDKECQDKDTTGDLGRETREDSPAPTSPPSRQETNSSEKGTVADITKEAGRVSSSYLTDEDKKFSLPFTAEDIEVITKNIMCESSTSSFGEDIITSRTCLSSLGLQKGRTLSGSKESWKGANESVRSRSSMGKARSNFHSRLLIQKLVREILGVMPRQLPKVTETAAQTDGVDKEESSYEETDETSSTATTGASESSQSGGTECIEEAAQVPVGEETKSVVSEDKTGGVKHTSEDSGIESNPDKRLAAAKVAAEGQSSRSSISSAGRSSEHTWYDTSEQSIGPKGLRKLPSHQFTHSGSQVKVAKQESKINIKTPSAKSLVPVQIMKPEAEVVVSVGIKEIPHVKKGRFGFSSKVSDRLSSKSTPVGRCKHPFYVYPKAGTKTSAKIHNILSDSICKGADPRK